MKVCVTGATGFVGGHVARELTERGDELRVTYRDERRLERLATLRPEPVKADLLDRAAMRRAVRGCELVFHTAGAVASTPVAQVWETNALGPRVVVEAAAAEGVARVVVTSTVAAIGPVPRGEVGTEDDFFRGGGLDLTYADSKHEGEREALAAGARLGVAVVVVNPTYVLGAPVDRSQPGETSTRVIGNYLRGRLPAVVEGELDIVDVEDVARGHLRAAERGAPGRRYVLGGHGTTWVELIERTAELSGVHHPVAVLPRSVAELARRGESVGVPSPIAAEGMLLMACNWCYSSARARKELGYRPRAAEETLQVTIDWYQELIDNGLLGRGRPSALSLWAGGMRFAGRSGLLGVARLAERYSGRQLVAGG